MGGEATVELGGRGVTLVMECEPAVAGRRPCGGADYGRCRLAGRSRTRRFPRHWPSACRPGQGGEAAADAIRVEGAAGSRLSREVRDGYLYLTGEWRDGDTVTFDFPMPVRMLAANPNVREDAGKGGVHARTGDVLRRGYR